MNKSLATLIDDIESTMHLDLRQLRKEENLECIEVYPSVYGIAQQLNGEILSDYILRKKIGESSSYVDSDKEDFSARFKIGDQGYCLSLTYPRCTLEITSEEKHFSERWGESIGDAPRIRYDPYDLPEENCSDDYRFDKLADCPKYQELLFTLKGIKPENFQEISSALKILNAHGLGDFI